MQFTEQQIRKGTKTALYSRCKAQQRHAVPSWFKQEEQLIQDKYILAAKLREESESNVHMDHIYPIKGNNNVCGLHTLANLRICDYLENFNKGSNLPTTFDFFDLGA